MKDFKKLLIWQKAMEIVARVYSCANLLPAEERFGLRSQMTRCAVSMAANVAEGSAKDSQKDYKRFIEMALGSSFELETHCLIIVKLGFVNQEQINDLFKMIEEEQRMLSAFIKALKD